MNAITTPTLIQDYRLGMQRAALVYLQRHQDEHLGSDMQQLVDNCAHYLITSMDVPLFMAPRLVELALGELESKRDARQAWIGIDHSHGLDANSVWLVDTRTHERFPIPIRWLPERLISRLHATH